MSRTRYARHSREVHGKPKAQQSDECFLLLLGTTVTMGSRPLESPLSVNVLFNDEEEAECSPEFEASEVDLSDEHMIFHDAEHELTINLQSPLHSESVVDNNLTFSNLTRSWGLSGPQKAQLLSWLMNPITDLSDLKRSVYLVEQQEERYFQDKLKVYVS